MENREAIEMLKGVAVYADTEYKKALNLAISALEKQETDRWIPVKERLPKNKKKVLVSYDTEDGKR